MPGWVVLVFVVAIAVNALAGVTTALTVGVMGSITPFANAVRSADAVPLRMYNLIAFPSVTFASVAYLLPLIRYFRAGTPQPAPLRIKRRALSAPLVLAVFCFLPWLVGLAVFPFLTVYRFGHWSTELMSQEILSPLVNGFLATTTLYFLIDLVFRSRVVPRVFADGQLSEVSDAASLRLRARLFLFLAAVAFLPLFTMLGLARGAGGRLQAGVEQSEVVQLLNQASSTTFIVYVVLGIALTLLLTRSLTRPLTEVARALRRIQSGDLDVEMRPTANDEVGIVEDGVNRTVAALRDRDRILQTFGRVVEPVVRDHLLRGGLRLGGELRVATVMFCDLRGFTAFAETAPPNDVVETLNEFFTAMTERVRGAGGFVDKFIGDALLVVFGLFDAEANADGGAMPALQCAGAMRAELEALNLRRRERSLPPLRIAGSIHTGEVVAGTIGAQDRHEFTVVGDTVNVAARLQEICKQKDWDFVASQATLERAQRLTDAYLCEDVMIRGRSEVVRVFRL